MNSTQPRSFASAVFWNTAVMAISFPVAVATGVIIGRSLGPAGKGEYTLAVVITGLLVTALNLGIPASISYYLAGRRISANSLVKTVVVLSGVLGALGIALVFLLDGTILCSRLFSVPNVPPPVWLAVLGLPFQFAGTFLQFVILAQGRRILFAVVPAIGQVAAAATIGVLLFLRALTPFSAVGALVGSQVLGASILLIHQQVKVRWLRVPLLRSGELAGLARYSALSHAGSTLQFLIQRSDVFLVSAFLDLRAVGLYSVAYGFAELLLLLPQRVAALYLPRVAAADPPAEKGDDVRLSSSLIFVATIVAAVVLSMVAPVAIRFLYGAPFVPAIPPFLLLLPGICALATLNILSAYISGVGKVRINTIVSAGGLAANLLLNLLMIPRYGISGAAVASSLVYCGQAFVLAKVVAGLTNARPLAMLTSAPPALVLGILKRVFR